MSFTGEGVAPRGFDKFSSFDIDDVTGVARKVTPLSNTFSPLAARSHSSMHSTGSGGSGSSNISGASSTMKKTFHIAVGERFQKVLDEDFGRAEDEEDEEDENKEEGNGEAGKQHAHLQTISPDQSALNSER